MVRFASRFTSQGEGGYAGIRNFKNRLTKKVSNLSLGYLVILQPSIFVLTKYLNQYYYVNKYFPYNTVKLINLWNRKTFVKTQVMTLISPKNIKCNNCAVNKLVFKQL